MPWSRRCHQFCDTSLFYIPIKKKYPIKRWHNPISIVLCRVWVGCHCMPWDFLHFWVEGSDSFSCFQLLSLAILLDILVTKYNKVFFLWASFFHRSCKSLNCHFARKSGLVYPLLAYTVPFLCNVDSEQTVLKTFKMSVKLTTLSTNITRKFKWIDNHINKCDQVFTRTGESYYARLLSGQQWL